MLGSHQLHPDRRQKDSSPQRALRYGPDGFIHHQKVQVGQGIEDAHTTPGHPELLIVVHIQLLQAGEGGQRRRQAGHVIVAEVQPGQLGHAGKQHQIQKSVIVLRCQAQVPVKLQLEVDKALQLLQGCCWQQDLLDLQTLLTYVCLGSDGKICEASEAARKQQVWLKFSNPIPIILHLTVRKRKPQSSR